MTGTEPHCGDCESIRLRHVGAHHPTVCLDCGWYTDDDGPEDDFDWHSIQPITVR